MLRKINGTNSFHIKFLGRSSLKSQDGRGSGQALKPPQVFYFYG
jgi:hypothetical protein